jgi:hypothetical protein
VCENFLPYVVHCFNSLYSTTLSQTPLAIDIAPLVDSLSRLCIHFHSLVCERFDIADNTGLPESTEGDSLSPDPNNNNADKEPNKQNHVPTPSDYATGSSQDLKDEIVSSEIRQLEHDKVVSDPSNVTQNDSTSEDAQKDNITSTPLDKITPTPAENIVDDPKRTTLSLDNEST